MNEQPYADLLEACKALIALSESANARPDWAWLVEHLEPIIDKMRIAVAKMERGNNE